MRNTQYELNNNLLVIKVKKAPFFVRTVMFFFSFLFFILPLTGMILGLSMGKGMHVGYLIGLLFFGILGFYMLRISLWNTFGQEIIKFEKDKITYVADYGWFKDGVKQKEKTESQCYSFLNVGYEEDKLGCLVIGENDPIICVAKISIVELEELIIKLNEQVKIL